jgi:hypothetical protein
MLVGRRCRHVVLLIKVSVISPDHRQVGATDAVSTMSMIEQQQGRVWGIRSVTRPAVTWDVIEIHPPIRTRVGTRSSQVGRARAGQVHTPRRRPNPADAWRDLDGDAG